MAGAGQTTGTSYVLSYRVNYSRYEAQETITLFKAPGEDTPKIVGYNVNSKGFIVQ